MTTSTVTDNSGIRAVGVGEPEGDEEELEDVGVDDTGGVIVPEDA